MRRRDQLPAAAAALRHRPARATSSSSASRWSPTCPASAATCRTTSRSTSSTPPSSRSRSAPGSSTGTSRASAPSGCSCAAASAPSNHFEAGGFIRSNDEVDYPNLMFHFLPIAIRYDGSRPAAEHGYQVHIGPMYSDVRGTVTLKSRDPFEHPALRFNYLSTENDRREWIEMVRAARHILNQPAFAAFNAGELSPGPSVETDQEILDWVAEDAETALHPSCTARMGVDDMAVLDPRDDAGARRRRSACRRRLVDALRHQRQHLRPRDDARREGRRPDPRQHPAAARRRPVLPLPRRTTRSTRRTSRRQQPSLDDQRGHADDPDQLATAAGRQTTRAGLSRPSSVKDLWKVFGPRRTRSSAPRTPTCPRRSCRRRPAACRGQGRLLRRRARRGLRRHGAVRLRQVDAGAAA